MNTTCPPFGDRDGDPKFSPAAKASTGIRGGTGGEVTESAANATPGAAPSSRTRMDAEQNRSQAISISPERHCPSMLLDALRDVTGRSHAILDRDGLANREPDGLMRRMREAWSADAGVLAAGAKQGREVNGLRLE